MNRTFIPLKYKYCINLAQCSINQVSNITHLSCCEHNIGPILCDFLLFPSITKPTTTHVSWFSFPTLPLPLVHPLGPRSPVSPSFFPSLLFPPPHSSIFTSPFPHPALPPPPPPPAYRHQYSLRQYVRSKPNPRQQYMPMHTHYAS